MGSTEGEEHDADAFASTQESSASSTVPDDLAGGEARQDQSEGTETSFDPFTALQAFPSSIKGNTNPFGVGTTGAASKSVRPASFQQRREELLESARAVQTAFVEDKGEEGVNEHSMIDEKIEIDLVKSPSSSSTTEAGDLEAANDVPPGFAFPVTKQIMQFLNKISTQTGPVPIGSSMRSFGSSSTITSVGNNEASASFSSTTSKTLGQSNIETDEDVDDNSFVKSNSGNISVQSTRQPSHSQNKTGYASFIQSLKDPQASDIVASIKALVTRFSAEAGNLSEGESSVGNLFSSWNAISFSSTSINNGGDLAEGPLVELSRDFHAAMRKLEAKMKVHSLWKYAKEENWNNTCEALEKFVLSKLHGVLFGCMNRSKLLSRELSEKIRQLSFLRPENLEVRNFGLNNLSQWQQAGSELSKMNEFKSPRDKLVCLLNACRLVISLLGADGKLFGADDLLPALIFVLLKENPQDIHMNIEYIAAFRNPARLKGEAGYFFTQLASAAAFLQTLDSTMLSGMTAERFDIFVEHCKREIEKEPNFSYGWEGISFESEAIVIAEAEGRPQGADAILPRHCAVRNTLEDSLSSNLDSAAHVLAEFAGIEPQPASIQAWKEERCRFQNRDLDDLTIQEVRALLGEYKIISKALDKLIPSPKAL